MKSLFYASKEVPKSGRGRKKMNLNETLPTPTARRVQPTISEDIKKKIQIAVKSKENKMKKGIKKENITELDDEDEFSNMVKSKKTLKDKLGTPEEISKKVRKNKGEGDGLKQTKLNFNKVNGSPKKRGKKKKTSDSEVDITPDNSGSDVEFSSVQSPSVKERQMNRRAAATKVIKYSLSGDEESSGGEPELFENDAVNENSFGNKKQEVLISSDEEEKPPPRHETSEDMFDSLIGKKKDDDKPAPTNKRKKIEESESDSDDMFSSKKSKGKSDTSDEDIFEAKKPPAKPKTNTKEAKPKKTKQKKKSDEDEPSKKTKGRKKKNESSDEDFDYHKSAKDSSDDDISTIKTKVSNRPGRGAAKSKYVFDDSDEDSD